MELNRKVARGCLSEIIGNKALDSDRIARTMGYERVAKEDWELLGEQEQQLIIDYCNGINAYIKSPAFKLRLNFLYSNTAPTHGLQWMLPHSADYLFLY